MVKLNSSINLIAVTAKGGQPLLFHNCDVIKLDRLEFVVHSLHQNFDSIIFIIRMVKVHQSYMGKPQS